MSTTSIKQTFEYNRFIAVTEIIKVGVATIDMLSIGMKFENFMQAGCRDQGSHRLLLEAYFSALIKYKERFISEKAALY